MAGFHCTGYSLEAFLAFLDTGPLFHSSTVQYPFPSPGPVLDFHPLPQSDVLDFHPLPLLFYEYILPILLFSSGSIRISTPTPRTVPRPKAEGQSEEEGLIS